MTTSVFDPNRYKEAQRQEWDAAAPAWERWGDLIEEGSRDVNRALIELAHVQPGHRVLDIASGTGEPALSLARHVGPTGRVVATDQSSRMLTAARVRAKTRGLQNLEFVEADAEALDFPEGSLDAVTCRFGLMFLPDLSGTLQRVRRSLRPGGWFVTVIWDVPPKVPLISVAMGLTTQMFDVPPPPPGAPTLFALSQPGALEQALTTAGFTNVRTETTHADFELRSGEEYTDFILEVSAPIATVVSRQPLERQEAFRTALSEAARQYAFDGGKILLVNSVICVAGQRGA